MGKKAKSIVHFILSARSTCRSWFIHSETDSFNQQRTTGTCTVPVSLSQHYYMYTSACIKQSAAEDFDHITPMCTWTKSRD